VGLLRPVTLWPFPYEALRSQAEAGASFLTVEDSLGQMIDDVRLGVEGRAPVHFLGMLDRHDSTGAGMLLPGRVLEEIKKVCAEVKV
jgi:2-oxoglutarate ferredoxin oxidoreductase subunit alpha